MKPRNLWKTRWLALGAGTISLAFAIGITAQVQTDTSVSHGASSKTVSVEKAQVVSVTGNDLVVKMSDGTLRHFPNVPESTRVNVDGKELGIHDLKPGMTLQRTIVTTTTPKVITTTQNVTGNGVVCSAPLVCDPHARRRKQSEIHHPEGSKIQCQRANDGRLGTEEGDDGHSD